MENNTLREKILDKVKKLLSQADGAKKIGSLNEADVALKMAARLMKDHNISEWEARQEKVDEVVIEHLVVKCKFDYYGSWEGSLAGTIAKYFFCKAIFQDRMKGKRANKEMFEKYNIDPTGAVTFIGTKDNIQICSYVFDFYRNNVNELAWKQYSQAKHNAKTILRELDGAPTNVQRLVDAGLLVNVRKFYLSFCKGASASIKQALEREFKSDSYQIIPAYEQMAEDYAEKNWRLTEVEFKPPIDIDVYNKGYKKGSQIQRRTGIK